MGDYALYKAVQSFTPPASDTTTLEFQKDDVFEIPVQSPFATSEYQKPGWLYAYNRRTGAQGYVPVECVKLLGSEVNNTVHHPSALGVAVSDTDSKGNGDTKHNINSAFFIKPILCTHCEDYIWGQGRVGVKCNGEYSHIQISRTNWNESMRKRGVARLTPLGKNRCLIRKKKNAKFHQLVQIRGYRLRRRSASMSRTKVAVCQCERGLIRGA